MSVAPVASKADLDAFIRLPWEIYKGDANWVPPLVSAERKMLSREKNPFFRHAEAEYFLAKRDGKVAGRIAAIVNRHHNEVHQDKVGFWGHFECVNDAGVAKELLAAAEAWLKAKGLTHSRGPANPSLNDPCGMLVKGFKYPPFVMMTYNPEWYNALVEQAGYAKVMDLLAYGIIQNDIVRDRLDKVAATIVDRGRVKIRFVDMSRFREELRRVKDIYNDAWERNWGFVPMTDEEMEFAADDMKAILLPEFVYFAEVDGEDAGFSLALPDVNHSLKRANGSLLPFGWFYFLKPVIRKIPSFRIMALGVKKKFQHLGIGTLFYQRYIEEGLKRGYRAAEFSWILENNDIMLRPLKQLGGKPYKTYRMYEKQI